MGFPGAPGSIGYTGMYRCYNLALMEIGVTLNVFAEGRSKSYVNLTSCHSNGSDSCVAAAAQSVRRIRQVAPNVLPSNAWFVGPTRESSSQEVS